MPASKRAISPSAAKIGERIRQRRMRKRLSLDQLGHDIGKSGPQIARYESGENEIKFGTLERIAAALGCSPVEFLEKGE